MSEGFIEKLEKRIKAVNSLLCVGLDPHSSDLNTFIKEKNVGADIVMHQVAFMFCKEIIDATKDICCSYKPNMAFFEQLGNEAFTTLKQVISYIPKSIPVILDCKRGDISTTADAYASSAYDYFGADAVTLSPYMGFDSISPFLGNKKFAFVLVKTSNASADELQLDIFESLASKLNEREGSKQSLGMVIGATDVVSMSRARLQAKDLWILAPGVGFQGGNLELTVKQGIRKSDGLGLIVPVSRGISRAKDMKQAALDLNNQLNEIRKANTHEDDHYFEEQVQAEFFKLCMECGVLKFGDFTLKSGRKSPYFFNAGLFCTADALKRLSYCYARTILNAKLDFEVVFGPAYKGIPLATAICIALENLGYKGISMAYDRKEAKDHGEGGVLVGAPVKDKKVLVVDDVVTSGLAVSKSLEMLKANGANVVCVIVALDRQEAKDHDWGVRSLSVGALDSLVKFLDADISFCSEEQREKMKSYREQYGIK